MARFWWRWSDSRPGSFAPWASAWPPPKPAPSAAIWRKSAERRVVDSRSLPVVERVNVAGKASFARLKKLLFAVEPTDAGTHLDGIDAGIVVRESGVGDVQPAHFQAPVRLAVAYVGTERRPRREIDVRNPRRHISTGKEHAAAEINIGRYAAAGIENPFEREGID